MSHPIYDLAAAEYQKALEEFKRVAPKAYEAFVRSKQTMDAYQDAPVLAKATLGSEKTAPPAKGGGLIRVRLSEAFVVRREADKWLRTQDGRRTSGQITKAILDKVDLNGPDFASKSQRVSSHLSVSKDFTNDRERGGYQVVGFRDAAQSAFM